LHFSSILVEGIVLVDDIILSSGAKILGKEGKLFVGRGNLVGIHAVPFQSTGENEFWAGIPANYIGKHLN
jgi:serine acetyltransferase